MGGAVRDFAGDFSDYAERLWREGRPLPGYREDPALALLARSDGALAPNAAKGRKAAPAARKAAGGAKRARPGAERREQERAERARAREESRIMLKLETLEAEQTRIESELATPEVYASGEKSRQLLSEYERVRAEIAALWDKLG